jgi:predicted alpha/beta superfamily hydrolase
MKHAIVIAMLSLAVVNHAAFGQDSPTGRLTIKSQVLGEDRLILIRTPAGYEGAKQRYPVLYMTDGTDIGHVAATAEFLASLDRMPQVIVVGITNTDRVRDLTPSKPKDGGKDVATSGGADKFLEFIETELVPQIDKTYRTEPCRLIAGHSLGGLLAMHAFATRNHLFNFYIASSPSLWWDNEFVIRETEEFLKAHKDLNQTIFMSLADEQGAMRSGFDKAKELASRYHPAGLMLDSMLLKDEDHSSVAFLSHYFGLKKIFDGWQPSRETMAGGLQAVEKHFEKLSARYKYTVRPPELVINQLGYQALGSGKNKEAIAVFKSNVGRYPNSANVYDSLAEAYEKSGRLELARTNYLRALQVATANNDPRVGAFRANFERVSNALKNAKSGERQQRISD